MGFAFKTLRRLIARPDRVRVIYDKEGTLFNPRSPSYTYPGIETILSGHDEAYDALIAELRPHLTSASLARVPERPAGAREPHWRNGYFSFIDARVAYGLTALRRPRRIVEIGSGNSTKFFRKALDDFAIDGAITAIDPRPRVEIDEVADHVVRENVLDVGLDHFRDLEAGDFLFFDGSHYVFNGSDTTRFFLEILPVLRPGVIVHVHDICLPFEYSALFTERLYNEQYLLACTIMDAEKWRPLLPVYYLEARGAFAGLDMAPTGSMANTSFWMERR